MPSVTLGSSRAWERTHRSPRRLREAGAEGSRAAPPLPPGLPGTGGDDAEPPPPQARPPGAGPLCGAGAAPRRRAPAPERRNSRRPCLEAAVAARWRNHVRAPPERHLQGRTTAGAGGAVRRQAEPRRRTEERGPPPPHAAPRRRARHTTHGRGTRGTRREGSCGARGGSAAPRHGGGRVVRGR